MACSDLSMRRSARQRSVGMFRFMLGSLALMIATGHLCCFQWQVPCLSGALKNSHRQSATLTQSPKVLVSKLFRIRSLEMGGTSLHAAKSEPEYFSVMTVGAAGTGKSETCNTLVGKAVFETASGMKSVTQQTQSDVLEVGQTIYRVYDSRGFTDTVLDPKDLNEMMTPVAKVSDSGIDAILLTFRYGRWGLENTATYNLFKDNFGESILNHTILVFTNCGTRTDREITRELRQVVPQIIVDLGTLKETGLPPVISMGDLTKSNRKDDRERLLATVRALSARNGGQTYDDLPTFAELRARRESQEDRIRLLPDDLQDLFFQALKQVRKGLVAEEELEDKLCVAESLGKIADPKKKRAEETLLKRELRNLFISSSVGSIGNAIGNFVGNTLTSFFKKLD